MPMSVARTYALRQMDQRLPQRLCFVLGGVFVTSLVVSDIIGGAKLVELGMAFGRHIWLRATGSTVFSQLMDTVVVQFINFGG